MKAKVAVFTKTEAHQAFNHNAFPYGNITIYFLKQDVFLVKPFSSHSY